MMKKPFELILRDAGSAVQTRSTGGGVEQRLLRMVRRRGSARLHVVGGLPLTLAARRAQAEARVGATAASGHAAGEPCGGANASSPRLHVVVCKGAAGVFPSKSRTST